LVFKRQIIGISDFIATQEGIYDVIITKNIPDIGNDCGYNPTSFKIEKSSPAIANIEVSFLQI
jgi:hypothetical protein